MTIAVLFAEGFEEVEAVTPTDYLRRSGITVITVSCKNTKTVTGSHGIAIVTDASVAELPAITGTLGGILVPGGMPGAANVAGCNPALDAIHSVWMRGGLVAAICAAPAVVLAKTGILKGKKYTCYPGMESDMAKWCGASWQELTAGSEKQKARCVADGDLITAAGPGAAEEFAVMLVRRLAGEAAAEKLITGSILRKA